MPELQERHSKKSQMGYQLSSAGTYSEGGGDIAFSVGMLIFERIKTYIPPGATINSATLTWNLIVKTQSTAQNASLRVRAHASGDSPILRLGVNEWSNGPRPETSAYTDWNPSWPASPPGDVYSTTNVANILQELVNRSDWQAGGYVTFITWCMNENGSDMSVRANNDYVSYPRLNVSWTDPNTDVQYTINRCENSEFSTEIQAVNSAGDTTQVPYWWQGNYFGSFVEPANHGTIARDTTFTRLPGVPTMRFTCGTPPVPNTKRTGPNMGVAWLRADPFVFCGWIYVSTAIPTSSLVVAGDPYRSGVFITARGQWVPFCSAPTSDPGDYTWTSRWPAVDVRDFQAGWQFWISEPTFLSSTFKQMPFNGLTPDPVDPGGVKLADHRSTVGRQQSSRVWTPRTGVVRNGTLKRVPRFIKRSDGILQLAEPIKGGPISTALPPAQIQNYPAGQTIAEL